MGAGGLTPSAARAAVRRITFDPVATPTLDTVTVPRSRVVAIARVDGGVIG